MKIADARVKKCKDITIIIDKKMRQRKIETEHLIIKLDDNNPFQADNFVKIVCKDDFDKIGSYIKTLKHERKHLRNQVKELQIKLKLQAEHIEKLESETENASEIKKGLLKSLIKH